MKKLNLVFVLLFIISLNFLGKSIVNFVSEKSLYNFAINMIIGLTFSVLVLVLLRIKSFKNNHVVYSLILSQGIIFYFLFTQPRLFDKILLTGFYISGIFLTYTNNKKKSLNGVVIIALLTLIFELAGLILFDRNFIFLNILKHFLVLTAGYTAGSFILKN